MNTILVTGASGQIGSDLVRSLRARFGSEKVLATDLRAPEAINGTGGPFESLDVLDASQLKSLVEKHNVDTVYHLASLLSAVGEQHPDRAWDVNINGLRNVLDLARHTGIRVFWPSSIAVFGPNTPRFGTPQDAVLDPTTIYGITKVSGEFLCRYYAENFGVDVRSVRFPGIISYTAPPGGGTTDYAVDIFYAAIRHRAYSCFLRPDSRLPMMYMPDAIRAMLEIMEVPASQVKIRTSYNLAAVSFSAEELVAELMKHIPDLVCTYEPDYHQDIADTWPAVVDDFAARRDWGWRHDWELEEIVSDMVEKLTHKLTAQAHP